MKITSHRTKMKVIVHRTKWNSNLLDLMRKQKTNFVKAYSKLKKSDKKKKKGLKFKMRHINNIPEIKTIKNTEKKILKALDKYIEKPDSWNSFHKIIYRWLSLSLKSRWLIALSLGQKPRLCSKTYTYIADNFPELMTKSKKTKREIPTSKLPETEDSYIQLNETLQRLKPQNLTKGATLRSVGTEVLCAGAWLLPGSGFIGAGIAATIGVGSTALESKLDSRDDDPESGDIGASSIPRSLFKKLSRKAAEMASSSDAPTGAIVVDDDDVYDLEDDWLNEKKTVSNDGRIKQSKTLSENIHKSLE